MRPYFFKHQVPTWQEKQAERFRERQKERAKRTASLRRPSVFHRLVKLLSGKVELAPWEQKAIQAAKEKRMRRRARNILWWSNDKTWDFSPYMSDAEVME